MDMGTCDCRMWDFSGIPCVHAMQAMYKMNRNPEDYLAIWFRKAHIMFAYEHYLNPVGGMDTWLSFPGSVVPLPPRPRAMPGTPKKKRMRAAHEQKVYGSNYLQKGHNARGCKNEKVEKTSGCKAQREATKAEC
uniref:uncharacterized protein LOC122587641 n=1 Tax=Erigeron canadensis TaxID=72917 RepID=UPI001CB942B9|nr:uncharacterized protein LOC122587641 [Erigeron canadensis]